MTIEHITFDSGKSGAHLVVLGAIHGNETCGPEAIRTMVSQFQAGEYGLQAGAITLVPVCNPRAYREGKRFIERNLNRHFYPKPAAERTHYEDLLDAILCPLLERADVLLDIHSYQSQGGPFAFLGTSTQAEIDYGRALGLPNYIYGWAEAFGGDNATEEQKRASIGTTDYMRQHGGIAITVECGHHHNANNAAIAHEVMLRAMGHCGLIAHACSPVDLAAQSCIEMKQVYYKESSGALVKPWQHCDGVKEGEAIARYDDGTMIHAPYDAVIVLPKTATDHATGAEWFYLGVETDFPLKE